MNANKQLSFLWASVLCWGVFLGSISAQNQPGVPARLIPVSGTLKDAMGQPLSGVQGVTFALYKDQQGGAALWLETQNVSLDEQGRYSVLLGATTSEGLPLELFSSGEARWLGVQATQSRDRDGAVLMEQPRVLLVSVPYALKAADAETLGGLPASAFVMTDAAKAAVASTALLADKAGLPVAAFSTGIPSAAAPSGSGTTNNMVKWLDASGTLGDAMNVVEVGGNFGIGTTSPNAKLHLYDGQLIVDSVYELRDHIKLYSNGTDLWHISGNSASGGSFAIWDALHNAFRFVIEPNGDVRLASGLTVQNNSTSPNTIGGYSGNQVQTGIFAATIGGGGSLAGGINHVWNIAGTVGGGINNVAGGFPGGGGDGATVSGGLSNWAEGSDSTVGGGINNRARYIYSTVGGGSGNVVGDDVNQLGRGGTVAGGENNFASQDWSTVSGGTGNNASGAYGTVGGGLTNTSGLVGTVSGGSANTASGQNATVGGGGQNAAGGGWATVAGGQSNNASGGLATVGGGSGNDASGSDATVGGGSGNHASGAESTVSGGTRNLASGKNATIGGGDFNTASSSYATVGGGYANTANDAGGANGGATVGGGYSNNATGLYATVPGGFTNTAAGDYSFAAGRKASANHNGAFVWGDSTDAYIASTGADQFVARASGGVTFYSNNTATTGVNLAAGGGSWSSLSDRKAKENFARVNGPALLEKLSAIPIETWNYRSQDASIHHMGPMAQDFYAAFGLGEDDRHITAVDADGVALAAIQALYRMSFQKDEQIHELTSQIRQLQAEMEGLKARLGIEVRQAVMSDEPSEPRPAPHPVVQSPDLRAAGQSPGLRTPGRQ